MSYLERAILFHFANEWTISTSWFKEGISNLIGLSTPLNPSFNPDFELTNKGALTLSKSSLLDKVYLDIETSDGRKFQSMCTPFSKTSTSSDQLQCNIEICLYPLDNVDIILPTKAPKVNGYLFQTGNQL